ncbi:hypothetical protein R80B4_00916 [Fibrobacteres bacterium R8-0-B4]
MIILSILVLTIVITVGLVAYVRWSRRMARVRGAGTWKRII